MRDDHVQIDFIIILSIDEVVYFFLSWMIALQFEGHQVNEADRLDRNDLPFKSEDAGAGEGIRILDPDLGKVVLRDWCAAPAG